MTLYDRNNQLTEMGAAWIAWHKDARKGRVMLAEVLAAFEAGWKARTALINPLTGDDACALRAVGHDGRPIDDSDSGRQRAARSGAGDLS